MTDTIIRARVLRGGGLLECEIVPEGARWKATVPRLPDFLGTLGDSEAEAYESCMCAAMALLGFDEVVAVDFVGQKIWPR